ncbi:hypothetical protein ELZ19_05750, partial [Brucella abortus]
LVTFRYSLTRLRAGKRVATIPRQRNRLCEKIATEIRKAGSKTAAGFSFTSGNPVLYAAADAKGMRV